MSEHAVQRMSATIDNQIGRGALRWRQVSGWGLWVAIAKWLGRLCCKPDVGVSQIRTTTVLSSCFCVGQTVL